MSLRTDDGADTSTDELPGPSRTRRRILEAGAVLLILLVAAMLLLRNLYGSAPPPTAFSPVLDDSFDRPSSASELGMTGDRSWTADAGVWGIEAGAAALRRATDGDNIATLDVGTRSQTMNVRIAGTEQCGIVVRYHDPLNFILMLRVNPFAVWNVSEVVDGKENRIATVPDPGQHDLDVSLTATDHVIAASVGFETTRIVHDTIPQGTRVGLLSRSAGGASCSWDDLTAQRAN